MINHLRRSVNEELRSALVGRPIPETVKDCANQIASIYNDLQLLQPRERHRQEPRRPTASPRPVRDPDAMELDNVQHEYAPKGSAERRRREREGRCFKCGSKEHISPACKIPLPSRRTDVRNASANPNGSRSNSRGRRPHRNSPSRSRKSSASSRSSRGSRSPKGQSRH